MYTYISIHLSTSIYIYISIDLSIDRSIYRSIYVTIYPSIYLSISQSIEKVGVAQVRVFADHSNRDLKLRGTRIRVRVKVNLYEFASRRA